MMLNPKCLIFLVINTLPVSKSLQMKCFIKNAWSLIHCRNESTMRFWVLTFESRLVSDMIQTNMLHQTFLFVKSVQILIFSLKYRCIIMRKIQNYEWIVIGEFSVLIYCGIDLMLSKIFRNTIWCKISVCPYFICNEIGFLLEYKNTFI
jgi:hypothetical protein